MGLLSVNNSYNTEIGQACKNTPCDVVCSSYFSRNQDNGEPQSTAFVAIQPNQPAHNCITGQKAFH